MNLKKKEMCYTLRVETGLGLMACKKCLDAYDWDYEKAKENHKKFQNNRKLIHYDNEINNQ